MYSAGNNADIPAPFDINDDDLAGDLFGGDKLLQAILEEERGDSAAKASKRTLAIVDNGTGLVLLYTDSHFRFSSVSKEEKKKRIVVEAPKSHGPRAAWVVKEINLGERGDFAGFPRLADAKHNLEVHSEYFLWCRCCGSKFGTRKNVWQDHLKTPSHTENASGPVQQRLLFGKDADSTAEALKRKQLAEEQVAHRIRVAKMVFSHSQSTRSRKTVI